jgi:hypothetical protein
MTASLDIDRIKKTKLGRLWLSRFVELVWEVVGAGGRERLRYAMHEWAGPSSSPSRFFIGPPYDRDDLRADKCLVAAGLLGEQMNAKTLTGRRGRGYWLTPLGVEVYLHGRRAGQRP